MGPKKPYCAPTLTADENLEQYLALHPEHAHLADFFAEARAQRTEPSSNAVAEPVEPRSPTSPAGGAVS